MTNSMQTIIKNPSWWRRRSTLERVLTLFCTVAGLVIAALIVGLVSLMYSDRRPEELNRFPQALEAGSDSFRRRNPPIFTNEVTTELYKECRTEECVHAASQVLQDMDRNIDPCDDFYNFACGSFIKRTIIPAQKVSVTRFSAVSDKLEEQIQTILEENTEEDSSGPFKLAKQLYNLCMNKNEIEDLGLEPIEKYANLSGGWPVIKGESWDENSWSWIQTVKNFRKFGFSIDLIVDFSIDADYVNSTKRVIYLDQSRLGINREYLIKGLNDTIVNAYYNYMVEIAVMFGANRKRAEAELKESLDFEIALANISVASEKRRNPLNLYNPMILSEVQKKYPYVDWLDYINSILPSAIQINENETVIIAVPKFFESLGETLNKTPKRTIANYMLWRMHAFSIYFLNDNIRKLQLDFSKITSGQQEREARWQECVNIAKGSFGPPVGGAYVKKYFQEDARQAAIEMVAEIRNEFRKMLINVDWMDKETRKAALNKAKLMKTYIGYPSEILDDDLLKKYYENLELVKDKYFESILNINVFRTNLTFNKFRKPVNKTEWTNHAKPAVVNAFYSPIENSIQFPAGILQGNFFSSKKPNYMNYGAIGYVIGHEITHGFDDQGRNFDAEGNLKSWWSTETNNAFLKKAECIINQYGNYTEPQTQLKLNGINTQGENIADNGGVRTAYYAYKTWAEKHGRELGLPTLKYTPEQLFWISAAQTWCSTFRSESLRLRIKTGVHSPGEFRVLGPLSNIKEFSKDFSCPEGSKMNPVKKCEVW